MSKPGSMTGQEVEILKAVKRNAEHQIARLDRLSPSIGVTPVDESIRFDILFNLCRNVVALCAMMLEHQHPLEEGPSV